MIARTGLLESTQSRRGIKSDESFEDHLYKTRFKSLEHSTRRPACMKTQRPLLEILYKEMASVDT